MKTLSKVESLKRLAADRSKVAEKHLYALVINLFGAFDIVRLCDVRRLLSETLLVEILLSFACLMLDHVERYLKVAVASLRTLEFSSR